MKNAWDTSFRYIVMVALAILFVAALWYVHEVFVPLSIAALFAYFLSPAVAFLTRRTSLSRKAAANIVYFFALALIITLPSTILPGSVDELQTIYTDVNSSLDKLQTMVVEPQHLGNFSIYLGGIIPALRSSLSNTTVVPNPQDALRVIQLTSRNFLWLLVILVTTYYLMTEWDRLRDWFIRIAPEDEQVDLRRLYLEIRRVWLGYLTGQIRLIVILAILYSLVWTAIGLPGAFIIGPLAGLLNLLPEVGPAGAALIAVIVALVEGSLYFPNLSPLIFAVITLGSYLLLNTFKTVWLQPRILGHSVLLHEGIVFVGIITALMLGGVLGVLTVVPFLATIGVVGRYIRRRLLGLAPFEDPPAELADPLPADLTAEPDLPPRPAPRKKSVRKKQGPGN